MAKVIKFNYDVIISKEYNIKAFNSMHLNTDVAQEDILEAMSRLNIKEKLQEGINKVQFTATFIPQPDNTYTPLYSDLNVEFLKEIPKEIKLSFWKRLKIKLNRKIKVKRNVS